MSSSWPTLRETITRAQQGLVHSAGPPSGEKHHLHRLPATAFPALGNQIGDDCIISFTAEEGRSFVKWGAEPKIIWQSADLGFPHEWIFSPSIYYSSKPEFLYFKVNNLTIFTDRRKYVSVKFRRIIKIHFKFSKTAIVRTPEYFQVESRKIFIFFISSTQCKDIFLTL